MDQNVGGLLREAEKIIVAGWGLMGEAGCVVFLEAEKGVGWVQTEITEIKGPLGPSAFHSRKSLWQLFDVQFTLCPQSGECQGTGVRRIRAGLFYEPRLLIANLEHLIKQECRRNYPASYLQPVIFKLVHKI